MLCQGPKNIIGSNTSMLAFLWFIKFTHSDCAFLHSACHKKLPVKFVLYKWRHNYEFNSASSSKDYLFVCCAQVKQKPYLKAPDDDLDPGTAAKIAWEIHKKRNESVMVELFDVRLPVLIFLLLKSGSIKTIIDDFLVQL